MTEMTFVLHGHVVPAVRMTQRSKWGKAAQNYLACREGLALQIKTQMAEHNWDMLPDGERVQVYLSIHDSGKAGRFDCDNQIKAVIDSLQGLAFKNDCCVDRITARRLFGSDEGDFVAVTVGVLE